MCACRARSPTRRSSTSFTRPIPRPASPTLSPRPRRRRLRGRRRAAPDFRRSVIGRSARGGRAQDRRRLAADPLGAHRAALSRQRGKRLRDADGFVDTGDMVELRGDRYYFVGRRDGIINVGGLKVHPEEVEAVINAHPGVQMSLVKARRNPITGAVVVADVVPKALRWRRRGDRGASILEACRRALPRAQGAGRDPLRAVARCHAVRQARRAMMRNVIVTGGSRGLGLAIARDAATPPAIASSPSRGTERGAGRGDRGRRRRAAFPALRSRRNRRHRRRW